MLHTRAGLFFDVLDDASVRLVKTANEAEPDHMNVVVDVTLTPEDFSKVIAQWLRKIPPI